MPGYLRINEHFVMAPARIGEEPRKNSDKNVPWYRKDIGDMNESARKLLEDYSKISPEYVNQHVLDVVRWRESYAASINLTFLPERPSMGDTALSVHWNIPLSYAQY